VRIQLRELPLTTELDASAQESLEEARFFLELFFSSAP